jgi:uncharacterized YccA/Bax inhibitor family protein
VFGTRNPVLSRGFAYDDLDPNIFTGTSTAEPQRTMTVEGTVAKAAVMFLPLVAIAAFAYLFAPPVLLLPAIFVALGLGLWAAISKAVRPGVMFAYAAVEGVVLGLLSAFFEARYPGIVVQAVLATLLTAGVVFTLYRMRIVRATKRFTKIVLFAGVGYVAFLLVNFAFALFGAGDGWGIYSTPLGLAIAAFGALLASAFLVLDFAAIEAGVQQGAPERYEWRAAFGLMVTLVWLYIEMLRLIAILRR